jgi:hypothetical protein
MTANATAKNVSANCQAVVMFQLTKSKWSLYVDHVEKVLLIELASSPSAVVIFFMFIILESRSENPE